MFSAIAVARPAGAFTARVNYALHCQGCHLADGRETPGLVHRLQGTVGLLARTPAGREYLVRLPNVASVPLDDRELAALLDWVVLRFAESRPGENPAPFSVEEIAPRRGRPLLDADSARAAALGGDSPSPGSARTGPAPR